MRGGLDALIGEVLALKPAERAELLYKVEVREAEGAFLRERSRLGGPRRCPRCGCERIARRGHDARGRQRWLCRGCARSFTLDTGGVLSRSHLPAEAWAAFARCFCARLTLRECAEECGVSLKTAWFMRVRACEALRGEVTVFTTGPEDAVEADEAFLPESFSGNHSRNPGFEPWRAPRRRGGGARERDTLLTVVGSDGSADVLVSSSATVAADARGQLARLAHRGTRVACEMSSSLGTAAGALGLEVARSYSGEHALNALNAVHSALKNFIARFRGVASRRMQRYMWWFCWQASYRGAGGSRAATSALLSILAVGRYRTTWRALFREEYAVEARAAVRVARTSKKG